MNGYIINTISKGIIGVVAPATGYAISFSHAEAWLRIVSLLAGIAVSCAMFVSIGFTILKKYRALQKPINPKDAALHEEESTTV